MMIVLLICDYSMRLLWSRELIHNSFQNPRRIECPLKCLLCLICVTPLGSYFHSMIDCVSNMRLLWSYYTLDISQILLYKILLNHPLTSIPRPLSPQGERGEENADLIITIHNSLFI